MTKTNLTQKKVVVIGGGTGIFPVTAGLRHLGVDISTIISVSDSGGSTGRIRDEFGFQPVGDLRQSLAALAETDGEEWIRKLLLYRFEKGNGLKGHNLGNLILTALQDMTGSTSKALFRAEQIFRLKGEVIPATEETVDLKIDYVDGTSAVGEHILDDNKNAKPIKDVGLTPQAKINQHAKKAIIKADYIIIGPGDYYASLMAALAPDGIQGAFKQTKAKVIYVMNLMTRLTQTKGMTAQDHLDKIEEKIGEKVDIVILNNEPIPESILKRYAKFGEDPVVNDLNKDPRLVKAKIISSQIFMKGYEDETHRELLRHDSKKLQKVLATIINQ
jgi:uncharacterized cofD-like protein